MCSLFLNQVELAVLKLYISITKLLVVRPSIANIDTKMYLHGF